jgi:hypothetical protein
LRDGAGSPDGWSHRDGVATKRGAVVPGHIESYAEYSLSRRFNAFQGFQPKSQLDQLHLSRRSRALIDVAYVTEIDNDRQVSTYQGSVQTLKEESEQ